MPTRIDLPNGQWADLKGPDDLTGADIDAYEEFLERVREDALGPELPPEPDPKNPAVMKVPERTGKFRASHIHRIRDEILARTIAVWSYDLPVPYEPGHREHIPASACRLLEKASDPAGKVLNGSEEDIEPDPKQDSGSTGTGGSSGTSPESTENPLPESQPGT